MLHAGYELNVPLRPLPGVPGAGTLATSASWLRLDRPEIVIETVKQAENGDDFIVRLYESAGASTRAALQCGFAIAEAAETNLIEEEPASLAMEGDKVSLDFRPFVIRTLRLKPRR